MGRQNLLPACLLPLLAGGSSAVDYNQGELLNGMESFTTFESVGSVGSYSLCASFAG